MSSILKRKNIATVLAKIFILNKPIVMNTGAFITEEAIVRRAIDLSNKHPNKEVRIPIVRNICPEVMKGVLVKADSDVDAVLKKMKKLQAFADSKAYYSSRRNRHSCAIFM